MTRGGGVALRDVSIAGEDTDTGVGRAGRGGAAAGRHTTKGLGLGSELVETAQVAARK